MTGAPLVLSRRSVLAGTGALLVSFSASRLLAQTPEGQSTAAGQARAPRPGSLKEAPFLDSWIRIDAKGEITVFTGKAELGQGIKTAVLQVAVAVEVKVVADTGRARLLRAASAVDAGQVVNPDGLTNQIEGAILQSASWTLYERVGFDDRRITTIDWSTYPIMRFDAVPDEVDVEIINRPNQPFLGSGETAQGPTAAAAMPCRVRSACVCATCRLRMNASGRRSAHSAVQTVAARAVGDPLPSPDAAMSSKECSLAA